MWPCCLYGQLLHLTFVGESTCQTRVPMCEAPCAPTALATPVTWSRPRLTSVAFPVVQQSGDSVVTWWLHHGKTTKWCTNLQPHLLFDNLRTTDKRCQKDCTVTEFSCPSTVAAYADNMNGVDRLDQNTRQNKSKKTMKWYRGI